MIDREACPDVCVQHMEINTIFAYYRKMFIYSRSWQLYREIVHTRPLSNSERVDVLLKTIQRQKYRFIKSLSLTLLLITGLVFWNIGSLIGYSSLKRSNKPG